MAAYNRNTAVDMNAAGYEYARPRPETFSVVENPHSASRSLSPIAVTAVRCAVAFVAVAVTVFFVKVLLIAAAFGYAAENTNLSASLEEARAVACDLEVKQSVYGNKDRVWALATEVYGMAEAEEVADVDVFAPAQVAGVETE